MKQVVFIVTVVYFWNLGGNMLINLLVGIFFALTFWAIETALKNIKEAKIK